ncbi:hypothetical protein Q4595_14475 [Wenyingzhuangia sp. 1_MG-2023]|nr:hypothetical protein [Wenyingzhuangia sp. 1_MG-2023]
MAHQLKLDIFTFTLKKHRDKEDTKITFKDFFISNYFTEDYEKREKKDYYNKFVSDFLDTFENKFALNKEETKGIHSSKLEAFPNKNIIDVFFNGGKTGISQNIFDQGNGTKNEGTINKEKVTTLPFYFKIWTPYDTDLGIVMIQSFTDSGVNSLVLDQLSKYFSSKKYKFNRNKFIPKEYKEYFRKGSNIYKISYDNLGLSKESKEEMCPGFAEHENLRINISITGFKGDPDTTLGKMRKEIFNKKIVKALDLDNPEKFETIAHFKSSSGSTAQARLNSNIDISPTYFLSNELKEEGEEIPSLSKIRKFTDEFLEKTKIEIGYTPQE